jgi:predicted transposase YdaD
LTWLALQAAGRREDDAATALRAALHTMQRQRYSEEHLATILAFIEQATVLPLARYRQLIEETLQTEGAAMPQVMSYIERKGWREGREVGREEGREEARVNALNVLLVFLKRKIGSLDTATTNRLHTLAPDLLPDLADASESFTNQDDLARWLTAHQA